MPSNPQTSPTSTPHKSTNRTTLWTVLSIIVFALLVLLLSTIDDPKGRPWIETSLLGQLLITVGAVTSIFGPAILKNTKDVAVVKHEVKNDHTTNLRVEGDDRHEELTSALKDLKRDVGGLRQEVRDDRRSTHERLDEHSHRVYRLEHPRRKAE